VSLTNLTVSSFIDEVAAGSPTPGGGSVSALAAALAAALVSMVGSLTLRKLSAGGRAQTPTSAHESGATPPVESALVKARPVTPPESSHEGEASRRPADVEADMTMVVEIAGGLRRHFERLVDEDAAAFEAVMAAYRLPKSSDEEKRSRSAAIQDALKEACRVPSQVAKGAVEVMRLADLAVREGAQSALSDAAVACLAADAALHGAYLNVLINLGSIKDQAFVSAMREEMAKALKSAEIIRDEVMARVRETLE
jgi:formiminotetrahydrofolate cyclodeaminase